MRLLYDKNYDEFGFVRISYLLVCTAKIGINVIVIGQIDSVGTTVRSNGQLVWYNDNSFVDFLTWYLNSPCDETYVDNNKKVIDYMNFKKIYWTSYGDNGASDMMHVKTVTVSNYIDVDGVEHSSTTWFSSINLDNIDAYGINYANNGRQTGIIISDHDDIFELYFTSMGGFNGVWDEMYNPFAKYLMKFYNSSGPVSFMWLNPNVKDNNAIVKNIQDVIKTFMKNENYKLSNNIFIMQAGRDMSIYNSLLDDKKST